MSSIKVRYTKPFPEAEDRSWCVFKDETLCASSQRFEFARKTSERFNDSKLPELHELGYFKMFPDRAKIVVAHDEECNYATHFWVYGPGELQGLRADDSPSAIELAESLVADWIENYED